MKLLQIKNKQKNHSSNARTWTFPLHDFMSEKKQKLFDKFIFMNSFLWKNWIFIEHFFLWLISLFNCEFKFEFVNEFSCLIAFISTAILSLFSVDFSKVLSKKKHLSLAITFCHGSFCWYIQLTTKNKWKIDKINIQNVYNCNIRCILFVIVCQAPNFIGIIYKKKWNCLNSVSQSKKVFF